MDEELSRQLHKDMVELYKEIKKETKTYNPTRFLQLLTTFEDDGKSVLEKLMEKDNLDGLATLCFMGSTFNN